MNDQNTLPELTDGRISEIEASLFGTIAAEEAINGRTPGEHSDELAVHRRKKRTSRRWMVGASAAAVVLVAAVITPSLLVRSVSDGADSGATQIDADAPSEVSSEGAADGGGESASSADDTASGLSSEVSADRSIITTVWLEVQVEDADAAAEQATTIATDAEGYVESLTSGESGQGANWTSITLRVPAEGVSDIESALGELGDVTNSEVSREDVTTQLVDIEARIDALEASVQRLTELMSDSASTQDLLDAEGALAERQAELESYQQQQKALASQVDMATITLSLYQDEPPAQSDPGGFGDGLASGWSGLVAFGNGLILALGFALPWLAAIGVVGVIVWLIVRLVRRRRKPAEEA